VYTETCASTLLHAVKKLLHMCGSSAVSILEQVLWCACTCVCAHLGVSFVPFWCLQACFSTFVWVQALDLVIVASRSGALCALPSDSGLSVQLCVGLVFASHIVITYLCAGTLVWRMDRDARQSFVRQQQHGSVSLAAA